MSLKTASNATKPARPRKSGAKQSSRRGKSAISTKDSLPITRPLLIIRDHSHGCGDIHQAAVRLLPFVRYDEERQTLRRWSVPQFMYCHQGEEAGRVFFEEAGRQYLEHGEAIEQTVCFALGEMVAGAQWSNVASGFLATLARYAMIGFASVHEAGKAD